MNKKEDVKSNELKKENTFYKKWWFIAGSIVIIIAIAVGIIFLIKDNKTQKNFNNSLPIDNKTEISNNTEVNNTESSNIKKANTLEELESIVLADVENVIDSLNAEKEQLITYINSYEKYKNNRDKIEAFYEKILLITKNLGIKMREYSIVYAEFIIASNKTNDEKYDDLEEIYDTLYEDFAEEIYDDIYDDIMEDMYDSFYNGIIDDAYDYIEYEEYSDARSNSYEWYSNTRSDVYDEYSDARSDVYDFYSDIRSEIYNDDIEDANKEIKDFKEDIEKIKNKNNKTTETTTIPTETISVENQEKTTEVSTVTQEKSKEENTTSNLINGMKSEFIDAMDSYEEFMNEYVEFIKKYEANPTDITLLSQYATMLQKYSEQVSAFDKWETEDMTAEEAAYYIEVQARVTKKLLEVQ